MASAESAIDKYEIIGGIGAGASGVIKLARNNEDGEKYVIKEMDTEKFDNKDVEHAMSEVAVLALFDHPNIIKHKESFVVDNKLCICMEYADGGDVEQAIKAQRKAGKYFEEDLILNWFAQLCLAMKHVHDRKVLHRDLKTQNVFLTSDGIIKLGDFGLTVVLKETLGKAETRLGTPYYMSPELCRGNPYNAKNDMWALGCILYKMCALRHAFLGKSFNELVKKIVMDPTPKVPRGFSKKTQKLVNALMEKNPDDRPHINQLLKVSFLKRITKKQLSADVYDEEFSHTTLHSLPPAEEGDSSGSGSSVSDGPEAPPPDSETERAFDVLKEKYAAFEADKKEDTGKSKSKEKHKPSTKDSVAGVQDLRQRYLAAQRAKAKKKNDD